MRLLLSILAVLLLAIQARGQFTRDLRPSAGRDCAVCHLEWVESFKQPAAVNLMQEPDRPVVAESETCLGCHDGSVADSRRQVWLEHGHKTGITPSAGMKIPEQLPLEDGKVVCRTCHTAHSASGAQTLKDLVFLRVSNETGQLCMACHADKSQGPEAGTHPIGKLPWRLPGALADAGAHAGRDNQQLLCMTCHAAHGAREDHLLVLSSDTNQLCMTCHEQIRPAMWMHDAQHEHPQTFPLRTAAQRQAIKDMGTRVGPDGMMICLSCHKMHHGQSGRAMLADTLQDSRFCIRCHPDRQTLAGTAHDLRKTGPRELNRMGQTPDQSGPCGSCHTFHSYARKLTPRNGDPQGVCTTCHSEGQVASAHSAQTLSHPAEIDQRRIPKDTRLTLYPSRDDPEKKSVACLSCHNPHESAHPHFLRTEGDELCGSCHGGMLNTLAGAHDFSKKEFQNARGRTAAQTGKCGFCHAVHNANGPSMWVATRETPRTTDDLCAECHRTGGLAGKPVAKFNHPTGPKAVPAIRSADFALPLFDEHSHVRPEGHVACATCHDIHASEKQSRKLIRATDPTSLCVHCHPNHASVAGGPHDPRKLDKPWPGANRKVQDLCTACHKPHSNDEARKRWAVAPPRDMTGPDAACVACHTDARWPAEGAPLKVDAVMHPQHVPDDSPVRHVAHGLPMADQRTFLCKTCHNPHGSGELHLLRLKPESTEPSDLCLGCHEQSRYVTRSMHSPQLLDLDKAGHHACRPCHATHKIESSVKPLLWAAKTDPRGRTPSEKLCMGCHSADGGAVVPTVVRHPETALQKLVSSTTQPTELDNKLKLIGEISCSTCHVPHGREIDVRGLSPAVARAMLSSKKPMLRPDVDRDICSICHGIDSTRVYLYFHNPKKRAEVKRFILQP